MFGLIGGSSQGRAEQRAGAFMRRAVPWRLVWVTSGRRPVRQLRQSLDSLHRAQRAVLVAVWGAGGVEGIVDLTGVRPPRKVVIHPVASLHNLVE